jgi:histone acetyltransferase (RNA polymerase elongator complex component)
MANIPIFIPHSGCKNDCAFCNQRSITGKVEQPSFEEADRIIRENMNTLEGKNPKIAFFGGSFTGIGDSLMEGYLKVAYKYVEKGLASGIRLSTRPDYINKDILNILSRYGVTNIELGAQSMDDEVLEMSKRGHDSECVRRAAKLINEYGFTLGLQMMIALPSDTREKSLKTAREFVSLGAKETRIYPTVIIENTRLAEMYKEGSYKPFSFEEAVDVAAECCEVFLENNVKILRIGLQNSETLQSEVVGGIYHDALGEIVMSRVIRRAAEREDSPTIRYNPKFQSKVLGQKRCNIEYFAKKGINATLLKDESADGVFVNGKIVLTSSK